MTPGSSVGFGLGDQQFALDSRGHGTGMTGLLAEVAAQHVAGPVMPACPAQRAARAPSLTLGLRLLWDSSRKGRR